VFNDKSALKGVNGAFSTALTGIPDANRDGPAVATEATTATGPDPTDTATATAMGASRLVAALLEMKVLSVMVGSTFWASL
jgi:hypothetical protein